MYAIIIVFVWFQCTKLQLQNSSKNRITINSIPMRKIKNNDRQDLVRMYKTPSPSHFADLKSPRMAKNANRAPQPNFKQQIQRNQPFDVFRAHLMQTKNKESNFTFENDDTRTRRNIKTQKNQQKNQSGPQDPYGTYFITQNNSTIQQKLQKDGTSRSVSRKTSISKQSSSEAGKNSYQETVRKLANQNIRLKHECKMMQQRCQKATQDKRNVTNEITALKMSYDELKKKNQHMTKKQNTLIQEIKGLKKMLSVNSEELSVSNYEIYKMKQEIFELKLCIERFQTKRKETDKRSESRDKNGQFLSEKRLPAPPLTEDSSSCKRCKSKSGTICDLITQNQNIKFQLGEKITIINSLCSQIQKLDAELKLLEKPRLIYKKFNTIIDQINQQMVNDRAKQLSFKYLKLTK